MKKNTTTANQLTVEMWAIDKPKDYPKNARTWTDASIAKVATSIKSFGFVQPIVVDSKGVIIIGHLRRAAARTIPLTQVPVVVAKHLTPGEVRQLRLMDNRSHQESEWDLALLGPELLELQALDLDLSLTGFDADELKMFMADPTEGLTDPDDCPAPQAEAISVAGDLWLLGNHRLLCSDSTDADAVSRLLGSDVPHLMVTDPPYGVDYDAGWRNEAMPEKNDPKRWKDGAGRATGAVMNDGQSDWREAWALFPGNVVYVWHADRHASSVQSSLEAAQFGIRCQIIWAKNNFAISRGHYHWQHEPCWYAVREGETARWAGDHSQTTLWKIDKPLKSETGHSTQKPVECMLRPMQNNSLPGDKVYDPFCGSGTSIIAAEQSGRVCFAMELSPTYVDMIIRRWQNFTGKQATLEVGGRTFAELEAERSPKSAAA